MYCNTNRLVAAVQTMINSHHYDRCFHDFLVQIATEKNIPNPEDFVAENFLNQDGDQVNFAGVNLMLRSIGVLR